MKKTILLTLAACANIMLLFFACNDQKTETAPTGQISQEELIKKGEYLVNAIGCDDCHTPKAIGPEGFIIDFERRFSGFPENGTLAKVDPATVENWALFAPDLTAAVGPWGVSFAANISSDESGIGNWTEQQFFKAIREGKYKGMDDSRPLLPPMPWFAYKNLSNEDLRAIFAYLKSSKPVRNVVPAPKSIADLNQ